jgi:hypothetical protein
MLDRGDHMLTMNPTHMRNGMYFLVVQNGDLRKVLKFVKI